MPQDGITPLTALTIKQADVLLSKADGTVAMKHDGTTCTADGRSGMYGCSLDAIDTANLGRLQLIVQRAEALPYYQEFMIIHANAWDLLFGTWQFCGCMSGSVIGNCRGHPAWPISMLRLVLAWLVRLIRLQITWISRQSKRRLDKLSFDTNNNVKSSPQTNPPNLDVAYK